MTHIAAILACLFAVPTFPAVPGTAGVSPAAVLLQPVVGQVFQPAAVPGAPQAFNAYLAKALADPGLNPWKRELLTSACSGPGVVAHTATMTSYCSACHDWPVLETATERGLHPHCAAADRSYWRIAPHSQRRAVIWADIPDAWGGPRLITLNDTGGAIRGPHRFDICRGTVSTCRCNAWGRRHITYIALRGAKSP